MYHNLASISPLADNVDIGLFLLGCQPGDPEFLYLGLQLGKCALLIAFLQFFEYCAKFCFCLTFVKRMVKKFRSEPFHQRRFRPAAYLFAQIRVTRNIGVGGDEVMQKD